MPPLLEVAAFAELRTGARAFRGRLSLQAGEVLALVGDNGAGKSTLIKHISGVYKADAGEIRLNGAVLDLHGPRRAPAWDRNRLSGSGAADDLSVGANVFSDASRFGAGSACWR